MTRQRRRKKRMAMTAAAEEKEVHTIESLKDSIEEPSNTLDVKDALSESPTEVPTDDEPMTLEERVKLQTKEPVIDDTVGNKEKTIPSILQDKKNRPKREIDIYKDAFDANVVMYKKRAAPRVPITKKEMQGIQIAFYKVVFNLLKKTRIEDSREAITHILNAFWEERNGIFNSAYIFRYIVDQRTEKFVVPENAQYLYSTFMIVADPKKRKYAMENLVDLSRVVDGLDVDVAEKLRAFFSN